MIGNMELLLWNSGTVIVIGIIFANSIPVVNKLLMYARGQNISKLSRSKTRIAVETIIFVMVFIMLDIMTNDPLASFYRMIIFTVLFGIGVSDALYKIIPNEYIIVIAILAVTMLICDRSQISIVNALAGGIAGAIVFIYPYLKTQTCGGGDVKLCASAGLAIGLGGIFAALISMGVILLIYTSYKLIKEKKLVLSNFIPLGPILSASIFLQIVLLDIIPNYARLI